MKKNDFKTEVEKAIISAKDKDLKRAMNLGMRWIINPDDRNKWICQAARYNQNQRDFELGVITHDQFFTNKTKVMKAFLPLLNDLDETSISPQPLAAYRIKVICQNEDHQIQMESFFQKMGMKEVEIKIQTEFLESDKIYDLIIFDNQFLKKIKSRNDISTSEGDARRKMIKDYVKMKKSLDLRMPLFLHFGEEFYLVSDNRNEIYAANSFFSLYSRIMEVLDFIRIGGGSI